MIIVPALRTLAQVLLGYILTFLISHGVSVPVEAQNWFVETVMVAGGTALYVALVRWLETSKYPAFRILGQILMLGMGAYQPTGYDTPRAITDAQDNLPGDHSVEAQAAVGDTDPSTYRADFPPDQQPAQ
jgi:hypothetical protein